MNFQIFRKLMALPLNASERAVTTAIVYHVPKDGDSSFPSYETIRKKSGCANKTISKVIRTLIHAEIMERKHRANTFTGKESNEYFFPFNGIRFTHDNLSHADYAAMESKLKKLRTAVTKEMAEEAKQKKTGPKISSQMLPIPSQMLRRSNNDSVPPSTDYQSQSTVGTTESQSQKQSTKVESNNTTAPCKDPKDQSHDEWWADHKASSYANRRG